MVTAEDVVKRIAAECAYVDERGGVGIRLKPAAAAKRQPESVTELAAMIGRAQARVQMSAPQTKKFGRWGCQMLRPTDNTLGQESNPDLLRRAENSHFSKTATYRTLQLLMIFDHSSDLQHSYN
jgi:hypothetical protein